MRRALLLYNPYAAGVSPRVCDVIAHALSTELKIDVAETKRRHHATHLAAGAVHDGYEAVVSLGGDGTLNEVVNGLAGSSVPVVPIPGGGTNVFARTLGLPKDPIEATSVVLEHLRAGAQPRRVNLGRVNGRAFSFHADVGIVAAIVHNVERRHRLKKTVGQAFFVAQAVKTFLFSPRRNPPLELRAGDRTIPGLHEVAVCNSDPFTYLGARPFRVCPDASLDADLDALALTSIRTSSILRIVFKAFRTQSHAKMKIVRTLHDVERFTVVSARPVPYQVDGDYAGEDDVFEFSSDRGALFVLT